MNKRVIMMIFPRNKYMATPTGKAYMVRERKKFAELAGNAIRVWFHTRVYAWDPSVTLNFDTVHGSFSDELPLDGPNLFALTKSAVSTSLPYSSSGWTNLPADGVFYVEPSMGRCDVQAICGGANGSIEFESWVTLEFGT